MISSSAILSACDRPQGDSSKLKITIPLSSKGTNSASSTSLFPSQTVGFTECYGVSVSGPGIETSEPACNLNLGVTSGMVAPGGNLTVMVPNGEGRIVRVFLYLSPVSTCPTLGSMISSKAFANLFKVGEVSGVAIKGDASVSVSVAFSGSEKSISELNPSDQACRISHTAALTSWGDILDKNDALLAQSSPVNDSIASYLKETTSLSSLVTASAASLLQRGSDQLQLTPYLRSFTAIPRATVGAVTDVLYGLDAANRLVAVESLSPSSLPVSTPLNEGSSCPFSACSAPAWIKSVSISPDLSLMGLDHSGNLYLIQSGGLVRLVKSGIPLYIEQIAF
jgi:hypothetical protein